MELIDAEKAVAPYCPRASPPTRLLLSSHPPPHAPQGPARSVKAGGVIAHIQNPNSSFTAAGD